MVSFDVISNKNRKGILRIIKEKEAFADIEYVGEVVSQLLSLHDGCEYALSASCGCLLVRVYDGEYFFLYPEPISDEYDVLSAIDDIRAYSMREEIPLVISEVPCDALDDVAAMFSHAETACEGDFCTVRALSEIMLFEELPELHSDHVSIGALCDTDMEEYARLCRDTETNKYWGYEYSEDESDPDDGYFLENARGELFRGVAASFAVRLDGIFIGEALIYSFDLSGGAECALRLLPEHRGKGLSSECIELLCELAKKIGIKVLYATVDERNAVSLHLFKKYFDFLENQSKRTRFVRNM